MTDASSSDPVAPRMATAGPSVEILLATYNSAEYLVPLMDSLLAQTVQDFHLVISDDCSRDDTVALLQGYLHAFRHPVRLTIREAPSGSAMANFAGLMQASDADYVFLCDADDIWHPDKLEKFLARARAIHADPDVPLFLFSDAQVIDGAGRLMHASYWGFKKITPARCLRLERLLVCTPMLGCAALMNRALVRLACHVPVGRVTGHDWWALLVAAATGHVDFLDAATISYRLHGRNSSQPKEVSVARLGRLAGRLSGALHEVRRRMIIRRRQAEPLLEQFVDRIPADRRRKIELFLAVGGKTFFRRRFALLRQGNTYPDPVRNLALFLFC